MLDNPDNHPTEQMIGKVIRVVHDHAQWGSTACPEKSIFVTLCANGRCDTSKIRTAFEEAAERELIVQIDGRWIPGDGHEKYLRPGTINSEVQP